jgi:hypothetical protein
MGGEAPLSIHIFLYAVWSDKELTVSAGNGSSLGVMADQGSSGSTYRIVLTGEGVNIERTLDPDVATEVIALVVGGSSAAGGSRPGGSATPRARSKRGGKTRKSSGGAQRKTKRRPSSPGLVKDLSMRPKGKKAFVDFAAEKAPSNHYEKQVVAVYWLAKIAGLKRESPLTTSIAAM